MYMIVWIYYLIKWKSLYIQSYLQINFASFKSIMLHVYETNFGCHIACVKTILLNYLLSSYTLLGRVRWFMHFLSTGRTSKPFKYWFFICSIFFKSPHIPINVAPLNENIFWMNLFNYRSTLYSILSKQFQALNENRHVI